MNMNGTIEGKRKLIIALAIILGTFIMMGLGKMEAGMANKLLMLVGGGYFGVDVLQKIFFGALKAGPPAPPVEVSKKE